MKYSESKSSGLYPYAIYPDTPTNTESHTNTKLHRKTNKSQDALHTQSCKTNTLRLIVVTPKAFKTSTKTFEKSENLNVKV